MYRSFIFTLLVHLFTSQIHYAQAPTSLTFKPQKGYNSFIPSFLTTFPLTDEDAFKPTLTGIPTSLRNLKYYRIIINEPQFFYQQFLAGKMTLEKLKQWRVSIESKELRKTPMKVATYVLTGEGNNGQRVWIADTDGDLSFNQEPIHPLLTYDTSQYTRLADNAVTIIAQRVEKEQIKTYKLPLSVCSPPEGDGVYYNHPQYWQASTTGGETILLQFGSFIEAFPREIQTRLAVVSQLQANRSIQPEELVGVGDYLTLDKDVYRVDSLSLNGPSITLKPISNSQLIESPQVGYLAPAFSDRDLISSSPINLKSLRGKYVLLDFWATWCGPCLAEFPRLKKISDQYGPDKFEIIGIVGDSKEENVRKLLQSKEVSWRQVVGNKICDQYKVSSYPATYLISPEGRIVYKGIKGEELQRVLSELIR